MYLDILDKHRPKDSESSFQCLQLSGERVIPSQPSSQRHLAVPGIPLFLSPSTPSDSSSDEKKQQPYTSGEEVAVEVRCVNFYCNYLT